MTFNTMATLSNTPVNSALAGLQLQSARPQEAATIGTASSSTDTLGTTFLSLLVKELQNQDPTAPMDSTAMVGQMISLNQLNQLTSINQALTSKTSSSGATGNRSSSAANAATVPMVTTDARPLEAAGSFYTDNITNLSAAFQDLSAPMPLHSNFLSQR